jgi:hypothetical protein
MDELQKEKIELQIEFQAKLVRQGDRNRTYYISLLRKKLNGEKLVFNSITESELRTLFWDELVNRKEIAKLFDVSLYQLDKKKKELDVMESKYQMERIFEEFQNSTEVVKIAREQVSTTSQPADLAKASKRLFEAFIFDHSEKELFSKDEVLKIIDDVIESLKNDVIPDSES